jgi:hypothetical protein
MMKTFPLGAVLTVYGHKMVADDIGHVYELLNYMTRDNLFTHQLPRAAKMCRPELLKQHPFLAETDDSGVNRENWREWRDKQVAKYGETLSVSRLPADDYEHKDAFEEACEKVGADRVITIEIEQG